MAKLYPPIIEGTIPAFWGDSITIPFSMNKVVNKTEIAGFSIKIKTVQNNLHLGTLKSSSFDLNNLTATFSLDTELQEKLNVGQYYKIQMAFIDTYGLIGYYSTVGVIKKTTKPEIGIQDLEKEKRNQALTAYIGWYEQPREGGDWTEKVYSYNFKVWDLDNKIIADSGELLHMSANDETANKSIDTFIMMQELTQNSTYYIQYTVTTTGGMVISQKYRLSPRQSVLPEIDAELRTSLNEENGYVYITLLGTIKDNYEKTANGAFLLSRRKVDEPGNWEELVRFGLRSEKPSTWNWKDFTVEQGVSYIYSIQQYSDKLYSQRILSKICIDEEKDIWIEKEIYVDFEHAFLFDGEKQLKIKYNPKVSSFKTTILESKMETLGSKHPFIFRNGMVSYKDFPISGLISYLMDEENLFMDNDNFTHENLVRNHLDSSIPRDNFKVRHTNLTGDNIQREREFKLNVLDWLNNGEPKLFRSPGEGNYIVRIMNSSLSPSDQVGRMLHTFQCNAYEIADYTYQNLSSYSFIRSEEGMAEDRKVTHWATIETLRLLPEIPTQNFTENILPEGVQANELNIQGMLPGDRISITYADLNSLDIVIGATGSYAASNIAPISEVKLWGANAKVNGMITYSYEITYSNTFGLYSNATSMEIPAKQIFGTDVIGINVRKYLEDLKTSILNVYYMSFEKRPIQAIYADAGKDIIVKDNNVDINISNLYYDRYKTQKVDINNLDPYTLYQIRLSALDNTTDIEHNQDYFLDNNYDKFFPVYGKLSAKNKAYVDGRTGNIMAEEDYSTKIYIDPEIDETENVLEQLNALKGMDLNETEDYVIEDLRPSQLFIGSGIMMTIGYCVSFVTYNFETNDRYESKALKDNYDAAVIAYENALSEYDGSETGATAITNAMNNVKTAYNALLNQIEKDLKTYNEENGLGEDE